MRWLLIPALLAVLNVQAQNTSSKLPKLRISENFFGTRYEIGDKDATKKDMLAHLKANQTATGEAYYLFEKANRQNTNSWIWLGAACVGGALCIYGIATDGPSSTASLAGGGLFVVSATAGLISSFGAAANYQRSVDTYNRFAGY